MITGNFAPTGSFISSNVEVKLPDFSGNGLSWALNAINTASRAQGLTSIVGGGTSSAIGLETGDELIIDGLEISGSIIKKPISCSGSWWWRYSLGCPCKLPSCDYQQD